MSTSSNSNSDRAIIIFDWDDTILPSSFVDRANAENLSELPQQFHNLFREIEQCTEKCLAAAAKHGEVSLSLRAVVAPMLSDDAAAAGRGSPGRFI